MGTTHWRNPSNSECMVSRFLKTVHSRKLFLPGPGWPGPSFYIQWICFTRNAGVGCRKAHLGFPTIPLSPVVGTEPLETFGAWWRTFAGSQDFSKSTRNSKTSSGWSRGIGCFASLSAHATVVFEQSLGESSWPCAGFNMLVVSSTPPKPAKCPKQSDQFLPPTPTPTSGSPGPVGAEALSPGLPVAAPSDPPAVHSPRP